MTAGPFCWQIDQMREHLQRLQTSFEQQQRGIPQRTARIITGLEHLLDELETASSELPHLLPDEAKTEAEALQQSEERFRTLAESIRDGLTILEEGEVVYLNDQAVEIFGYPRDELVRMSPLDMAEPEEIPVLTDLLEEARSHQTLPAVLEFWIHRKDGSRRCIQNRFTAQKNGRYSVITSDVTSRRFIDEENARHARDLEQKNDELWAAAEHLRRLTADLDDQKERLRSILTAIPEEILIIGPDLRIEYVNPPAAATFRMNTGDAIEPAVGVPAEPVATFLPGVIRIFSEGGIVRGEFQREVNGASRHMAFLLSPVHGRTGEVEAVLAVSRDVTSRVTTEAALAQSERRYRSLVDLAPDAIAIHWQGRFLYLNPAGARIFGAASADELIGTDMIARLHPDDQAQILGRIQDIELERVKITPLTEVQILQPGGQQVTIEVTSTAIPYDAGRAIHSVLRDISPRKRVEKDLQRAILALKESNRDLEQFAYVASHDLNEPLRTVLSYIQLLKKRYGTAFDSDGEEMIEFIVEGAERMRAMIADLLNYSRLTRQGPAFETVDCERLLTTILSQLGHLIEKEGALVTHDPLPCVCGDPGQLQQVFLNLITNALKFHGPAPPEVHISAAQNRETWTFAVQDNGIGIPVDAQDRIFLMFQRLHTQTEFPGTGIGLAICRKVIERHGGTLWVESRVGEGSTFQFTIPAPGLRRGGQVR